MCESRSGSQPHPATYRRTYYWTESTINKRIFRPLVFLRWAALYGLALDEGKGSFDHHDAAKPANSHRVQTHIVFTLACA